MTREELIQLLQKRTSRTGVMTADRWMCEVQGCLDGGVCPISFFEDKDRDDWAKCLKAAEQKLTYTRDDLLIDTKDIDTSAQDDGALMRFSCTLTTSRRDRDGDILETKGAVIDENMPLLWQHISMQPVGGFHRTISHTEDAYRCGFNVADIALGHDVTALIEVSALRMSHGFEPDFERMELLEDGEGWLFPGFKVFEGSVVSIPSNVDGLIESYEKLKFYTPMVEQFCKGFWQARPVQGVGAELKSLLTDAVDDDVAINGNPDAEEPQGVIDRRNIKESDVTPCEGCDEPEETGEKSHSSMPPIIESIEGSWEWVANKLEAVADDFVKEAGITNEYFMTASVVVTYADKAIVCVMNYNRPYSEDECFECSWGMVDGVPAFSGEPTAVEVVAGIRERFIEVVMAKGHIKEIESGTDEVPDDEVVTKGRDYDVCERQLVAAAIREETERLQETVETLAEEIKSRQPDELTLILQAVNQDLVSA